MGQSLVPSGQLITGKYEKLAKEDTKQTWSCHTSGIKDFLTCITQLKRWFTEGKRVILSVFSLNLTLEHQPKRLTCRNQSEIQRFINNRSFTWQRGKMCASLRVRKREREGERQREMLVAAGFCRAQHYFTQDWIRVCVFSIPWTVYSAAPCLLCVTPLPRVGDIITPHVYSGSGTSEDKGSPHGQVGHRDGSGAAAFLPMTRTQRAGRMALTSREMLCLIGTACLWLPLLAEVRTVDWGWWGGGGWGWICNVAYFLCFPFSGAMSRDSHALMTSAAFTKKKKKTLIGSIIKLIIILITEVNLMR